jgi:hypothetical protein
LRRHISYEEQWTKTASLAERWLARYAEEIDALPRNSDNWYEQQKSYLAKYFKSPTSLETSWRVDILESVANCSFGTIGGLWQLGRVTRNTNYLVAGDFVLLTLTNGMDRHPIWTYSSRGRSISGLFAHTDRLRKCGIVQLLQWPDELVGLQPTDPGARKYVVAYAQAGSHSG